MKKLLAQLFIFLPGFLFGQMFFAAEGSRIFLGNNVQINGDFEAATNAEIRHEGELHVSGNVRIDGLVQLNGRLELEGKWISNGTQIGLSNEVVFLSDTSIIEGNTTARFAGIRFPGNGPAQFFTQVECDSAFIHNRLVNTRENRFVIGVHQGILRENGYVISDRFGGLQMPVPPNEATVFPVGSVDNYLPVELQAPSLSAPVVRFAPVDASAEDLPRSFTSPEVCSNNASFYHVFNELAEGTSCRLFTFLDTTLWDGLAERALTGQDVWTPVELTAKSTENEFFVYEAFNIPAPNTALILYTRRPNTPQLVGPFEVCAQQSQEYFVNGLDSSVPLWEIAGGTILATTDSSILVEWGDGNSGLLSVRANAPNGCTSQSAQLAVVLNALPEVQIGVIPADSVFTYEPVFFTALVNESMAGYAWTISPNEQISDSAFSYLFSEVGNFEILLEVSDSNGCKASAEASIEVIEAIELSNAFSPNGDGMNDHWKVKLSGILSGELSIYDRWGVQVLQSSEPQQGWDGRTPTGELLPAGTYFYILKLQMASGIKEQKGSISLFY